MKRYTFMNSKGLPILDENGRPFIFLTHLDAALYLDRHPELDEMIDLKVIKKEERSQNEKTKI